MLIRSVKPEPEKLPVRSRGGLTRERKRGTDEQSQEADCRTENLKH